MRLVTYLLVGASLVFAFIFLQHHYGVKERFQQWWNGGTAQSTGAGTPGNSAWPTSADHDYRVIIDVSGRGPFMSVVHGTEPAVKKAQKRLKKNAAKPPGATKDRPQPTPEPGAPPARPAAEPGVKSQ
jgi:hypothetical protein